MSDTNAFETFEKVEFLFKNYLGYANTQNNKPFFQETEIQTNNYIYGSNIFLDVLPTNDRLNWNTLNQQETENEILADNYTPNTTQIQVDARLNPIVKKYIKVKLKPVPLSGNQSYYALDQNRKNILQDAIQSNVNKDGSIKPYLYTLYKNDAVTPIPNTETGGNWVFDIKNGVINFVDIQNISDPNANYHISESLPPYLTFVKYVGRKGTQYITDDFDKYDVNFDASGSVLYVANDGKVNNKFPFVNYKFERPSTGISGELFLNTDNQGYLEYYTDQNTWKRIGVEVHHGLQKNDLGAISVTSDISLNDVSLNTLSYYTDSSQNINVEANLVPPSNQRFNLGSSNSKWDNVYGNNLLANFIEVNDVFTTDISAVDISASTLTVTDISAVDISAVDISASNISTSNLNAEDILSVTFQGTNLGTSSDPFEKSFITDLSASNLGTINDTSNNLHLKSNLIPSGIKDASNIIQISLGDDQNIFNSALINDISLNRIGYLSDTSKNIMVNGHLIPAGPYDICRNVIDGETVEFNLSKFSLGSFNNRWRSLYVSDKTIWIGQSSISTKSTTTTDAQGREKTTIELLFIPEAIDKDDEDSSSGSDNNTSTTTTQPTSISIAKGEFLKTVETEIDPVTNQVVEVETFVPIDDSFAIGNLLELGDVDISKNELQDGNTIVFDSSNEKFIIGPNLYVNKSNIETLQSQLTTLDSTVSDLSTNKIYISTWKVTAVSGAYKFTGPGNLTDTSNPDIYLVRGQQYKFSVNVSGHPFRIQTQTGTSGNVYGTGVTGNGNENGDITFDVPMEAPSRLYYQCAQHNNMNGNIFIGDKIYDLSQNLSTFETNTATNFTRVNERVDDLDVSLNNLNTNLRSHIDNVVSGLDIKDSVKYASSENIGISGFDTTNGQIDGNTLIEGDRILLVGQTDKTQNGIYKKLGPDLVRTNDFNSTENVSGGAFCFVEGGDTNSGKGFVLTNTGAITIGSTPLDFTQFSETGLADGVVTTAKLDTNAVTAAKLASNAVLTTNIENGNVTTLKIADGAVTEGKLAETYIKQGTSSQRNIAVDGNLIPSNGTYTLGSAGHPWKDIFVSNNTIYFDQGGVDQDEIAIGISKTDIGNNEDEYSLNLKIKGKNDNAFKNIKLGKGKINKTTKTATDDAFVGKFTELEDSNIHSLTGISGNFIIVSDDKINAVTPSDVRTRISVKSNDQFDASFSQVNTRIDNINTSLTVKQVSLNTSANNQTHADISTISFDNDSGFNVTNTSTTGEVKISLGSHWKTIQIDGTDNLTPSGEESLNLVNGTGINITGDSTASTQSLTFSLNASIKDLTDTPSTLGTTGQVLKVNGNALEFGDLPSSGSSTFTGLTDTPSDFSNQGGKFLKVNDSGTELIFTDAPSGGSGASGGGDGIKVVPSGASTESSINYPTANTGSGKEGEIIYDASKNKFYGATNSKEDGQTGGTVAFRPLGYSFFAENMEGQPPAPAQDSFFFFLTSKTIVIKWTNPTQFETGLTGPTSMDLNYRSPIVTAPDSTTGGQIWFPIVNRIMIQIKNLDDNTYETWGTRTSPISNSIIVNGRVICEKDRIIPPASNTVSNSFYYFGPRYNYGSYQGVQIRGNNDRVYKLKDFANSIILYKDKSIPDNLEGTGTDKSNLVNKRIYSAKQGTDTANEEYTLPDSENGFEISIWLENQYDSGNMGERDFNIVKLTRMNRIIDENGNEVTSSSSNGLKNQIGQPIRFLTVDPPTKIRVADYGSTDGFHVKLKRIPSTTIHYLECIIPQAAVNSSTLLNEDNIKVESTQSAGQENEVYFKGYFIEYQTIEADTNATKNLTELATEFNSNGTSWTFVNFETFSSNTISFNDERANDTDSNKTMAEDDEAELGTVIYPLGTNNNDDHGFISAAPYSGGFSTKTEDITWSVSKAFTLNQGDNKFYRFRIRGLNSGNKNVGPVSEKYFYFRVNEPDQITWNTTIPPKFKANQLSWDITLNWNSITNSNSSKADTDTGTDPYTVTDLAIMEYKLQRRDSVSESWQTISYWENANNNPTTHDYTIWPTPYQTEDNNYESNSQTNSWSTNSNSNKAEWVYYEETPGGTKIYTQEARLLGSDSNSPYKTRNPTYYFRIQARNYLFGKRVDVANSDLEETSIKQWFVEGTLDSTNSKNITDSRWSSHSSTSAGLITTAHTYNTTTLTGYTPLLQDNSDDKYEIKFYEKDSADTNSPWKNQNGKTDYDDTNTRRVKYTNDSTASRTTTTLQPYNNTPTSDYISYQWKITDETNKTTVDSTTGLSIDRYEIVETYSIGTSSNTTNVESTPTTIIYSPDFRRGPANWHIRVYNQYISSSPSFKYKVRAFNFFNSTSSKYSADSTQLTPIVPSSPRYLSSSAISGVNGKENSNPTFALTDDGISILVDEPEFTGQTSRNLIQYQDQAISLTEFALQNVLLDSGGSVPSGEITLINGHSLTSRSGSTIQGNQSQVATFYHPNGYTSGNLKDLTPGKVEYSFHAKNVLKDEFSATSSCSLTIGKPNPGANFKSSPKFTWVSSTNKVKLEFFRKYSNTDILYDDPNSDNTNGSTIAPLSAVTPNNCKFSNTVKKLAWEVRCATDNSKWDTVTNIPNAFATNTSFTTTGDNSNSTSAYTISDIDIEDQTTGTIYTIDYRIRNQYNQNYFASNVSNDIGSDTAPLQIKLTEPNLVTSITSKFRYALSNASASDSNNNNNLTINWTKPSKHGLQYKHQGENSLTTQTQPNIQTYIVYFYDSDDVYYKFTRTASTNNYPNVAYDVTIQSGWNSTNGLIVYSDSAYSTVVANGAIRLKPETTYTVEKITAINWLYNKESPAQDNTTASSYYNGINSRTTNVNNGDAAAQYPPIDGSTQITSSNAPKPIEFSNYINQGILISAGSTTRTVKILGAKDNGTALTNVLLNAANVKGTSSIMGIKIKVTDIENSNTVTYSTECKFDSDDIVSGDSLTLTYNSNNLALITVGGYSDLYTGSTSSTDNTNYWYKNASIKLKWLSEASNIASFYGKNLKFSTVVTYYASSASDNIEVTREIENGYYDKTIGDPSDLSITPNYTPFTCLGLPILELSDTLEVTTSFDNQSSHWVASTAVNTITLGTNVASQTTSKSNHVYTSLPVVTLTDIDMGSYSGSSLKKDAQITVVAKNCNGTISDTHSSKYIYDPNTLALIDTINSQNLTSNTISSSGRIFDSNSVSFSSKPLFNVLQTPNNFNPLTDHGSGNNWSGNTNKFLILDVTSTDVNISGATNNNISQTAIYDGKFVSETYFRNKFGTSATNYQSNVTTFISNMDGLTPNSSTVYADSNNTIQENLKTNYRWGIFSMSYKNTSQATAAVNYAEFSLGPNSICNFVSTDLYSQGGKTVANIEIWYKCINDGTETRWNKLTENNSADQANATNDVKQSYTGTTAAALPSSGWILNAADTSVSSAITSSNESTWASTKRIQFLIKQEVKPDKRLDILIAIGIKNNLDRFYGIPRAYSSSYIYRASGSSPYNAVTIG